MKEIPLRYRHFSNWKLGKRIFPTNWSKLKWTWRNVWKLYRSFESIRLGRWLRSAENLSLSLLFSLSFKSLTRHRQETRFHGKSTPARSTNRYLQRRRTNSCAANNSQHHSSIILILLLMKTQRPMSAWNESNDAARYDASVKKLKKTASRLAVTKPRQHVADIGAILTAICDRKL